MLELNPRIQKTIIRKINVATGERLNISSMTDWLRQSEAHLPNLLGAFDYLIFQYNYLTSREIPEQLQNARELRSITQPQGLPLIFNLLVRAGAQNRNQICVLFDEALKNMNGLMLVGERNEISNHKFYLKYHTRTTDPFPLAVGTMFHLYEELIKLYHPQLKELYKQGLVRPDIVVDALVEILLYKTFVLNKPDRSSILIEPLSNAFRLSETISSILPKDSKHL